MSKVNLNSIIYVLIGLIIGTVITMSVVLILNNRNDKKLTSENTIKLEEQEIEVLDEETKTPEDFFEKVSASKKPSTLKEGFVTIVDFLFYGKSIKGKKFSDLTESAKLRVIKAALYLDEKIDSLFPEYKEKISNGTKTIYNSVKSEAIKLYVDLTNRLCNKHSDFCNTAKEEFGKLKETLNITWAYLKDLGVSGWDKLKARYESFREA